MQRIIIKNFGPIKDLDLEIKDLMIFIGEQGTGKSTIAKLVWFFKVVCVETITEGIQQNNLTTTEELQKAVSNILHSAFTRYFSETLSSKFSVSFHYNDSSDNFALINFIKTDTELFSQVLFPHFDFNYIIQIKEQIEKAQSQIGKINVTAPAAIAKIQEINNLIQNDILQVAKFVRRSLNSVDEYDASFQITSRESTVTYEYLLGNNLTKFLVDANGRQLPIPNNWWLLEGFLKYVGFLKQLIINSGGSFEILKLNIIDSIQMSPIDDTEKTNLISRIEKHLNLAINISDSILKGKYLIKPNQLEYLKLENGVEILLGNTSSGQKEAIRILQDIYISLLTPISHFKIIEEPEAHLFPMAQKHLCELFALFLNHNPQNQLMLTTHSPYILSSINNLLYASKVATLHPETKEEVATIIPEPFWLSVDKVGVYSLGFEQEAYCMDIVAKDTGLIAENFLDSISEELGEEFDTLYNIRLEKLREGKRNATA